MTNAIPHVNLKIEDHVACITLSNPVRRNAITINMWAELAQIGQDLAERRNLRVAVMRGAGNIAFSSGADVNEFGENRSSADQAKAYQEALQRATDAIQAIPFPVIAQIQGYCVGAGTAIALACDLRYLDETARIGIPAAKLGIGYGPDCIHRLVRIVGQSAAAEMLMTANLFDAAKALRCGFANEVLQVDEMPNFIEAQVKALAGNAPLALAASKICLREIAAFDSDRDWPAALAATHVCAESQDYQQALTAFAERRTPKFSGK